MRPHLVLMIVALAAASIAAGTTDKSSPPGATPDSALGLSRTSVFSVATPPSVTPNASGPGEAPKLPRAYAATPPRVPHGIGDFLPITRSENQCLGCHERAVAVDVGAVALPASHYLDLRNAPTSPREQVAGARYVCVTCHVPLTDQKPLVGNTFKK